MPRTRMEVDRERKVAEIVDAAKAQALGGGFGALSVAAIARQLGVAQNAIYWYFPTRDHLFVAVLRQLVDEVIGRKPPTARDEFERAVWLVDRVAEVHPLLVSMRARAREAEVVAEFEREIDGLVHAMVANGFGDSVTGADLDLAIEAFLSTVEGALLRQLPPADRARVVTFALARLSGRGSATPTAARASAAKRRSKS